MHIAIDGYTLKCEGCGKPRKEIEFDLQMVYLWANQFGSKIRLFCHRCGAVYDVTFKPGTEPVIQSHSMKCAIFKTKSEV